MADKLDLGALEQECDPAVALTMSEAYYQRRILDLIARIRELESASQPGGGWQPIETATRDGKRMLLMATHHQMLYPKPEMIVGYYDKGWWSNGGHTLSHVTHWMPLPAAPSAGNGGAEKS